MIAYVVERLFQSLLVLVTVALVSFVVFQYVGDPVQQMIGQDTSPEDVQRMRANLGLDQPVMLQFAHFLGNVLTGNFGVSLRTVKPVGELLAERLPATLELSMMAGLFALAFAIPLGVLTGLRPRHWVSRALMAASLVGISLPTFLIGILLILLFGVVLKWLPTFGRGDVVQIGFWSTGLLTVSGWKSIVLPAITLGLFQLTLTMRLVRAEMLEVLRTDYIKFARARGLSNRAIHFGHALKNTLIPVITIMGLQIGGLIAFSIITETVFQWPGMGLLFLQAIQFADIPVMSTYLLLIALFFVGINLVVDLLYYLVDPRLRADRGAPERGM
ncbi:MAG: ABC transporter permease [Alphaproteobacteria bacterium]|nr:ABC transporter permease [Alphaproteobacteria bacterium]